jgi:hypothetical protein
LSAADDDYVRGNFQVHMDEEILFGCLHLTVKYVLDEMGLQELIDAGKAIFVTHIECSLVGFRKMFMSQGKTADISIDIAELSDETEVSTFIMAQEDIGHYMNKDFNDSYGRQASFSLTAGNVLAIGPEYSIDINRDGRDYDKMADILSLQADEGLQESYVSLDEDCLIIHVSRALLDRYHQHKQTDKYMMISLFLMPAMVTVLSQMKEDTGGEWRSFRWYGVIEKLLQANGIAAADLNFNAGRDKRSVAVVAQSIFKYPLEKALQEMEDHRSQEEER